MFTWRRKTSAETIFTPFLEWCYERVRASLLPLDREHLAPTVAAPKSFKREHVRRSTS
jgi:hypothetical protein